MRNILAMACLGAAVASLALAADRPQIAPGQYEITTQVQLPPEVAARLGGHLPPARTRSHCIKPEQAHDYYGAMRPNEGRAPSQCSEYQVSQDAGAVVIDAQCNGKPLHIKGTFGSGGYDVDMQVGTDAGPMSAHVSAKRVGNCAG